MSVLLKKKNQSPQIHHGHSVIGDVDMSRVLKRKNRFQLESAHMDGMGVLLAKTFYFKNYFHTLTQGTFKETERKIKKENLKSLPYFKNLTNRWLN